MFTRPTLLRVSKDAQAPGPTGGANGFTVIGGDNNVFIDCEAKNNPGAGFSFSGSGSHSLIGMRSRGNRTGISISDDARLNEFDSLIE